MRRKNNSSASNHKECKKSKNERDAEDKRAQRSVQLNRHQEQVFVCLNFKIIFNI